VKAGASILHIHVRDPKTGLGTQDYASSRSRGPDSQRGGLRFLPDDQRIPGRNLAIEQRLTPLALKPELVSYDAGSINMGKMFF